MQEVIDKLGNEQGSAARAKIVYVKTSVVDRKRTQRKRVRRICLKGRSYVILGLIKGVEHHQVTPQRKNESRKNHMVEGKVK